jgi:hypothetical protein
VAAAAASATLQHQICFIGIWAVTEAENIEHCKPTEQAFF